MPVISIEVDTGNGEIKVPSEIHVSVGDTVTWQVSSSPDAPWLVSFLDGRAFEVESIVPGMVPATNSLEVRKGQKARALSQKGRFLYRLAFVFGDKIYGIFDCPTIIIK